MRIASIGPGIIKKHTASDVKNIALSLKKRKKPRRLTPPKKGGERLCGFFFEENTGSGKKKETEDEKNEMGFINGLGNGVLVAFLERRSSG
jgi:hypothetical protein